MVYENSMSKQENIYQCLSGVSFLSFLGSKVITKDGINVLCCCFFNGKI